MVTSITKHRPNKSVWLLAVLAFLSGCAVTQAPGSQRSASANPAPALSEFKPDKLIACVKRNEAGWPILPVEALEKTVDVLGPKSEVINAWRQQIVEALALRGQVKVFYKFANANGVVVEYSVAPGSSVVQYVNSFERNGLPSAHKALVFEDAAITGYTTVQRSGKFERPFYFEPVGGCLK